MKKSELRQLFFAFFVWAGAVILALKLGAVENADIELIAEIRLPRIILASAIGMGLSIAGVALQSLFSNPLCEPYTIGISSGSAIGAVLGTSLGLEWTFAGVTGTAFLGAMVFTFILFLVSLKTTNGNIYLLLTGVMLGFLGNSLVTLWIAMGESNGLQGALIWLFGDLSRARMKSALFTAGSIFCLTLMVWGQSSGLDALLLGEEAATSVGVDIIRIRRKIVIYSALLIALCVSSAGMIGFVGLVVPHFARRLIGSLHFKLIPLCSLWGATTLTLADCVSRILARPYELPVGVVTALIGAPAFLWIMLKVNSKNV